MSDRPQHTTRRKPRQRKIGHTPFDYPCEARLHPSQLGFDFTANVNAVQASDADVRSHSATGAGAKTEAARPGAHSILRYWR
jgi:hypothetical protein